MIIAYGVDLQNDFMDEDGALYVPGAIYIKSNIEILTTIAQKLKVQRVFSVDRHSEGDAELIANGGPFPPHCMTWEEGSLTEFEYHTDLTKMGIHIIPEIDLCYYDVYESTRSVSKGPQDTEIDLLFEKQTFDIFTNENIKRIFEEMGVTIAFVYGVATDYCVKDAVLGMLNMGIKVCLVTDAIECVDADGSIKAMNEMVIAGAELMDTLRALKLMAGCYTCIE